MVSISLYIDRIRPHHPCLAVLAYFQEYERWTEDQIRTNILNIYNKTDISNFSNFDPLSIML